MINCIDELKDYTLKKDGNINYSTNGFDATLNLDSIVCIPLISKI